MTTETLEPDGIAGVFKDLWTNVGGASKVASVTDAVDGNYVWHNVINERQDFTMANPVVGDAQVLSYDSMTINVTALKESGTESLKFGFGTQAGAYCDSAGSSLTASYVVYSASPGNPAAACGAWTRTDIEASDTTMYPSLTGGLVVRVTKITVDLVYTLKPENGGFIWLLQTVVPPLLGLGSHGLSLRDILVMSRRLNIRPTGREELELVRNALTFRPRFA